MGDCIDAVSLMLGTGATATASATATAVKREKEQCKSCSLYFADIDEAKSHWAMAHGEPTDDSEVGTPPVLSREEPTNSQEVPSIPDHLEQGIRQVGDTLISSSTLLRPPKFNCGDCNEAFPTLGFLFRHLQLAHDRITPAIYECRACGDAFTKLGYRERHVRKCCPWQASKALSAITDVGVKRPRGRPPGSKSKTKLTFNDSGKTSMSTLASSSSVSRAAAAHGGKVVRLRAFMPAAPRPIAARPPAFRPFETASNRLIRCQPEASLASSSNSLTTKSELLPSVPLRMKPAATATANISTSMFFGVSDLYKRPVSSSLTRLKPAPIKSFYWCKTCADPIRKCSLHRHML